MWTNLPWLIGSLGTMVEDLMIFAQFRAFGEGDDEVRGEEEVSAMLWDSDKRSADDLVGRVNVSVREVMKRVSFRLCIWEV